MTEGAGVKSVAWEHPKRSMTMTAHVIGRRIALVVGDRGSPRAVLDVIRQARSGIALSLFRCNDDEIFDELAAATARGVQRRRPGDVASQGRPQEACAKLWRALEETGVRCDAYTDPVVKYHAKYLVADDGPALVASLNFTRKCFEARATRWSSPTIPRWCRACAG